MQKNKSLLAGIFIIGLIILANSSDAQPSVAVATEATDAVLPYRIHVSKAALSDLRQRVRATRWPNKETVSDQSQGVQLTKIQELLRYWGTDYDWRKAEAKLNALPQFVTSIDRLDIHFIHVRSRHANALPLIITHGWPGSILELVNTIGPLTDPTAYGGSAEDAFDVVIPYMPGYGFSGKPNAERSYKKLIYFNEVKKGGHFASWEEPQLFAEELRAAFKSLR